MEGTEREGMSIEAGRVKQETEDAPLGLDMQHITVLSEPVAVKEQAETTDAGSGVSEAAMLAGLYTDHEVKDELVLGPEGVQHPLACGDSAGSRGSEAAMLAGLYTDHVVKDELVLGPECVQRPHIAYIHGGSQEARGEQPAMRECTVRLERVPLPHCGARSRPRGSDRTTPSTSARGDSDIGDETYTTVDYEKDPICEICGRRFGLKSDLMEHVVVHIHIPTRSRQEQGRRSIANNDSPRSRREPCLVSWDCWAQLERFQPAETTSAEQDTVMRRGTTTATFQHAADATYVCDSCGKQFNRKHSLILHMKAHLRQKNEMLQNNSTVNMHKSNHMTKSRYSCEPKNESSRNVNTHTSISIHTGERRHFCDTCKKTFKRVGNLRTHELIHTGEKPFSCEICKRKFRQLFHLKNHKRIHTGEKPYTCDLCQKEITTSSQLNKHRRIHTGERPYSCEICQKKFTEMGTLKKHHRIHTGARPYSCDVCKKGFSKSYSLNEHKRIHTGERPYVCIICEKRFTQLSTMKSHRRIHTGEKLYSCKICKMAFTRLATLRIHERRMSCAPLP